MITAIDTNVLLDVLIPNENFFATSIAAIEHAAASGSLVVCEFVYAELCIHFDRQKDCDGFLENNEIGVDWLNRESLFLASRTWRRYREKSEGRARILGDFLIAAHAQIQASRLLSRDRGFYRQIFPDLHLIDPAAGRRLH